MRSTSYTLSELPSWQRNRDVLIRFMYPFPLDAYTQYHLSDYHIAWGLSGEEKVNLAVTSQKKSAVNGGVLCRL